MQAMTLMFPQEFSGEVQKLSVINELEIVNFEYNQFTEFNLNQEKIKIYYRVQLKNYRDLSTQNLENILYNCICSRSSDGYIRGKALLKILNSDYYFVIPFILLLASEYVIEILEQMYTKSSEHTFLKMSQFLGENSEFYPIFKSKIVSYWNEYYRKSYNFTNQILQYPSFEDYVGYKILQKIKN